MNKRKPKIEKIVHSEKEGVRINKYLKDNGITTRRYADVLIERGLVLLNDRKARIGDIVGADDEVKVDNKVLERKLYYIAYNKPKGILTNKDDEKGNDILSVVKFKNEEGKPIRVFPLGRLDKDSHGLILLTNDGRITDKLLSPRFKHEKEYIVRVDRAYNDYFLDRMAKGVRIDGYVTKQCQIERIKPDTFGIILTEGKKRQIRRMCEALHYEVKDLQRIRVMNILLGKMHKGDYRLIEGEELNVFLHHLHIKRNFKR